MASGITGRVLLPVLVSFLWIEVDLLLELELELEKELELELPSAWKRSIRWASSRLGVEWHRRHSMNWSLSLFAILPLVAWVWCVAAGAWAVE